MLMSTSLPHQKPTQIIINNFFTFQLLKTESFMRKTHTQEEKMNFVKNGRGSEEKK